MNGNVLASLGNALLLGKLRQPASHDNVATTCYLSYSLPVYTHPPKTWLYYLSSLTDVCSTLHFHTHSHTINTSLLKHQSVVV